MTIELPRELPSHAEPMPVARVLVDTEYGTETGDPRLRHWRGGWWQWKTSHWVEAEQRAVRAELYELTEHAFYVNAKGKPLPWQPNRYKIGELHEALAACVHLPETIDQPTWIGGMETPPGVVVACSNGLLHLDSRRLYEHSPRFFNQTAVPFDFDDTATEPTRWLNFLSQLWPDDDESVAALQEFFGYVISGRLDLQKILLMVGPTRAGKGAITRILGQLVGRANVAGPTMSSLSGDFGLAPLLGKPLAVVSDARLGGRSDSSVVVERLLSISGEDTITVNRKYRDQWTGKLPTRFVLLSNELPHLGDASAAVVGRFVPLQLARSWLGREDLTLEPDLQRELPGILNWSLDGLDRLGKQEQFTRPSYVDDVLLTLADLASPVAAFVRDRCERGALFAIPVPALFAEWKQWADDNGQKPGSAQRFGRDLRAVMPELKVERPRDDDNRQRWYRGVSIKGKH